MIDVPALAQVLYSVIAPKLPGWHHPTWDQLSEGQRQIYVEYTQEVADLKAEWLKE